MSQKGESQINESHFFLPLLFLLKIYSILLVCEGDMEESEWLTRKVMKKWVVFNGMEYGRGN